MVQKNSYKLDACKTRKRSVLGVFWGGGKIMKMGGSWN